MIKRALAVILCLCSYTVYGDEDSEIECLAKNIYFEARGENVTGQFAVAQVTLNRVESDKFPDSICGVVYQAKMRPSWKDPTKIIPARYQCQFSWYCDGVSDEITDWPSYEKAMRVASISMYGRFEDVTNGALFYHRLDVDPHWNKNMVFKTKIGAHKFYAGW